MSDRCLTPPVPPKGKHSGGRLGERPSRDRKRKTKKLSRRDRTMKRKRRRVSTSFSDSSRSLSRGRSRSRRSHSYKRNHRRRRRSSSSSSSSKSPPAKRRTESPSKSNDSLLQSLVTALRGGGAHGTATTHLQGAQNIITEFDPKSKLQTMKDWLSKINESAEVYGWSERQTIFYALPKLSGLAKKWYDGLTSVKYSWSEWQAKLLQAFPCDQNYGDLLSEMLSRRSRRNETLVEYYYDKIMLINRCELKGRQAVDCITHGIFDHNIRLNVQGAHYEEPEQVLNYFRNITTKPSDSFQPYRQSDARDTLNSNVQPRKLHDQSQDRWTNKNSSEPFNYRRSLNNVTCYNCGEKGHTIVKCTKQILKCTKCRRHGHVEANCSINVTYKPSDAVSGANNVDVGNTTKKVLTIEESRDSNLKYFKSVRVNDVLMEGYIDFGSECTLISDERCRSMSLTLAIDNLPTLRGFGNSAIIPTGKTQIRVVVDLVDIELTAYAVSAAFLPADILIGQSLTEVPSVRVYKTDKELTLYQVTANKTNSVVLKADNDCNIKNDSIIDVNCSRDYTGFVSIVSDMRRNGDLEYFILPGLYYFKHGAGRIVAVGLGDKDISIPKGQILARGISVPKSILSTMETDNSYMINVRRVSIQSSPINEGDFYIDADVDPNTEVKLREILNSYRDCFALTISELGKTSVAEMQIKLNDQTPVTYRPYRLSISEREQVNKIIKELLTNYIIRESDSEYASPVILVTKKNGDLRLCVDYRALNRKTIKDKYPMPLIDDQIDSLQGQRFFTTLDLTQGYHQIPMAEDSKHLTAFVTPDGHFEYNRMPFGLTNAPAVFQRMVHSLLNKRKLPGVVAYMDDIVIGSKTIDEGIEKLQQVLDILREANLTLNLSKCHFLKTKIEYLGFEVSADGVRPGTRKTDAVAAFSVPQNVHDIRRFIGLASFFRRFVRNFATIARPLTSLTKANTKWVWGKEQTDSFTKIKEILTSRPVLTIFNPKHQTELHTDASRLGLGGVLLQRESDAAPLKVVAYFSRQTTAEEQHFHSFELETLAIVMSLSRFRVYLIGIPFKVVTDCNALRTTLTKRDLVPRIARWWLLVQDYDFTVEYRSGAQMQHADCLSRNPLPIDKDDSDDFNIMRIVHDEHSLKTVQLSDPRLKLIKCILDRHCSEAKDINNNYELKDGKIYKKIGTESKWVVPRDARWKVCQLCHDESGHFSYEKTMEKMRRDYWFPGMTRFVKKYVRACIPCAYAKEPSGKKQGFLYPISKPSVPFECVHIDHVGPFVRSKTGNTYVLGIIDAFSKFIVLRAVRNTKSRTTIQVMRDFIGLFGSPKVIVSDRGTSFTSAEFKKFVESNQIKHVKNAVATPRANGQIERYNRSILTSLTALNIDKDDRNWDSDLGTVQWSLNNTLNKAIGKTPVHVVFGKETVNLAESHLHDISENLGPTENIDEVREVASTHLNKQQEAMKVQFDKKRCTANRYKLGDLVVVLKNVRNVGDSSKLMPPYSGPYKVSAVLGNDRYEVCSIDGFSTRKYKNVYSADKIKPWIRLGTTVNPELESESDSSQSD